MKKGAEERREVKTLEKGTRMDGERTPENGVDVNDEGIWRARGKGV